jgi:hypothetical protein
MPLLLEQYIDNHTQYIVDVECLKSHHVRGSHSYYFFGFGFWNFFEQLALTDFHDFKRRVLASLVLSATLMKKVRALLLFTLVLRCRTEVLRRHIEGHKENLFYV